MAASQQVIENLKKLEDELDKISSAVKHIDQASKVVESTSDLVEQISVFINDLKLAEKEHRSLLLDEHKQRVESVCSVLQALSSELEGKGNQITTLIEEVKAVEKITSDYFTEIQKINFPDRLDKVDNQISSINIGVGNLQSSLQTLQQKVEKQFDQTTKTIADSEKTVTNELSSQTKELVAELRNENQALKKGMLINRIILMSGLVLVLGAIGYSIFISGN